jgi:hypothetical protein
MQEYWGRPDGSTQGKNVQNLCKKAQTFDAVT